MKSKITHQIYTKEILHLVISEDPNINIKYGYWGTTACGKVKIPGIPLWTRNKHWLINNVNCKSCMKTTVYKELVFKHILGVDNIEEEKK